MSIKDELFYSPKNAYDRMSEAELAECHAYAEDYKKYLTAAKTERLAVSEAIKLAEAKGFKPDAHKENGRVYCDVTGDLLGTLTVNVEEDSYCEVVITAVVTAGPLEQVRLGIGFNGCPSDILVSDTDGKEIGYKMEQFFSKGENRIALYKDAKKVKITGFKVQEI